MEKQPGTFSAVQVNTIKLERAARCLSLYRD
ncbi:MAG: hypothetical protein EWM72_01155 [Nitrospira sp.]|nr:MAG: hypothetical protein EWM72_01155 [Nitrospira sp.]